MRRRGRFEVTLERALCNSNSAYRGNCHILSDTAQPLYPIQATKPFHLMLRRSTRRTTSLGTENSLPSGSEYHESEKSMEVDGDADAEGEDEVPSPQPKVVEYTTTSRGRKIAKRMYRESEDEEGVEGDPVALDDMFADTTKAVKANKRYDIGGDDDESDDIGPRRRSTRTSKALGDFIVSDDDQPGGRYPTRSRNKKPMQKEMASTSNGHSQREAQRAARAARNKRRSAKAEEEDGGYVDEPHSPSSPDGEFDDAPHTSSDLEVEVDGDGEADQDGGEAGQDGRPYALRQRSKINYAIPPPLEEVRPTKGPGGRGRTGGSGKSSGSRPGARRGPGWSATGAELGRWMGMPGDDSVGFWFCHHLWPSQAYRYLSNRTRIIIPGHLENHSVASLAVLVGLLPVVVQV